jgi:hypothetical protein
LIPNVFEKNIVGHTLVWNGFARSMSEFKFACPVCGQHITADSRTSGAQLDCPTCFQKLIIPQAPASGRSNLILSATQVGKPRPAPKDLSEGLAMPPRKMSLVSYVFWTAVIIAAASGAYIFREQMMAWIRGHSPWDRTARSKSPEKNSYHIPTNFVWTMNLKSMPFPDGTASGGIRGQGFLCERATLQGGNLTLRQGRTSPPDLGITVQLFAKEGEELSGKTVEVGPERPPPIPTIVLRWKDENDHAQKQNFTSGYALRMSFGQANNARMPGKIFVALPDEAKSFVAGSFEAEIRKAQPKAR